MSKPSAAAAAAPSLDTTGAVSLGAEEIGGAGGESRGSAPAPEPEEAVGSDYEALPSESAGEEAEQEPIYLAYCKLRHSVTPLGAAEALRAYALDQLDGDYALQQVDLLADDIASIRPA